MFKKVISLALSVVFSLQTCGFAQVGQLNLAGYLGQGSGAPVLDRFRPASLRYFSYEPDSDNFKILLDKADEKDLSDVQVKDKADELMRYFRIGLSLPNDKFWVNLRPDAPEQIIDPALEQTDMGKIMLEADLQLKKDTSSLTSPQTKEGKEYWDKLYQKAGELFGTENITIPTITRPWIVPGEIIVRQSGNSAYIYKAALKVMLEEDYLKSSQLSAVSSQQYAFSDPRLKELNKYSTQLIRELIIPQLTKEVNRARRYAGLRQVYYSLILARWFKQSYQNSGATEHQGIRAPVNENNTLAKLIDSGSLTNLTSQEPWSKDTYYQGYKKSFEQGEYNLSQTVHTPTGQLIRRYVSGGISAGSALEVANYYDNPVGKIPVAANGIFFNYPSEGKTVAIASGSPLDLRLSLISSANALLESLGINIPMGTDLRTLRKILYKKTMEFNKNYTLSDMKNDRLINEWRRGMADLNKLSKTVSLAIIVEEMAEISRKLKEKTGSDIKETKLQGLSEKLVVKIEELKKYIAASPLTLDKEMSQRLEGWKIFESIEMLALNQAEVSFETNILIGKKVCTVIKASTYQWGQTRPLNIKFWTIELLENAESKDPVARINVYRNGEFKAMTAENLSDTERDLIVAKVIRHFSLDKSQMAELEKKSASSALTLEEAKNRALGLKNDFLGVLEENAGYILWKNYPISKLFVSLIAETKLEGLGRFIGLLEEWYVELKKSYDGRKKNLQDSGQLTLINKRWGNVSKAYDNMLKGFQEIQDELMRGASSAIVTKGAAPEDIGAVDFRSMNMLIQPMGSFSGLDFSPMHLSSSALEAMDLDKGLENIKQMASSSMLPSPQRLKEYISACIFKGKIDEKADDFILSMLEVFQLQAEEGRESAPQEREAVVLADTKSYVLPEKGKDG